MKAFARRRAALLAGTLLALAALGTTWQLGRIALRPVALYTGWALLVLVAGLAFFNARKKLPFLPLLSAAAWTQAHIYAGWTAVFVYFLHTGFRWPDGSLELLLALVFLVVCASGAFGLWLSRWLPPRLTRSGESLVYERIPLLRHGLLAEVKATVRKAEQETQSTTLADFHLRVLGDYFFRRPGLLSPLIGDDATHHRVAGELKALRRFLNAREAAFADELAELVETKRNLDFQLAAQRLLKVWLWVHVPLTYALLVLMGAHIWLALHYSHRL